MKRGKLKQPAQPIFNDRGVARFKANAIVRFLLDWATSRGMSLNELACMEFTDSDRSQFAQLIGYSVGGYGDLDYALEVARFDAEVEKLFKRRKRGAK